MKGWVWGWGCSTLGVVVLVLLWEFATRFIRTFLLLIRSICSSMFHPSSSRLATPAPQLTAPNLPPPPHLRLSDIITDLDLKSLIDNLDEELHKLPKWDSVIDKRNNSFSYNAKCCKPKDSPLLYLSVTVFEGCSAEILRDFYMDNFYRQEWDKTLIQHAQLEVDESSGTEIGRMIKKFPLLMPREYILAWRLWEGRDGAYYCYSKECEHPLALRQKKYVRVGFFRSGWRIRKVPGRNACEIRMVHQEDAGLNVEMAKLVFSKGIWSYVCKMDNALRKYSDASRIQLTSAVSAITLVKKVPAELDMRNKIANAEYAESSTARAISVEASHESNKRKLLKRPSNKSIANGLLLVGGVICLSRGHVSAKVAMAYILSKLAKCSASSCRSRQASAH